MQGEKQWRATAETVQLELDALKAQSQQRADDGKVPTQVGTNVATAAAAVDKGVDPAIFGDFSEAAIAKGIVTLQQQASASLRAEITPA